MSRIKIVIGSKKKCNRLMELYNWQKKNWPHFTYDDMMVEGELFAFVEKSGMVSGIVKAIPEELQQCRTDGGF